MNRIKEVLDTDVGLELKDYILNEYFELCNIKNVKDCESPEAQALEIKAQKKAAVIVRKILSKIMSVPEDVIRDKELDQYNV